MAEAAPTLKFGLTLPQRGILFGALTPKQMVDMAVESDRNPLFSGVWVGDSLFAKPRPDSIALLGGLATATQRVTLGVGCMASFPVRDPVIMAYQWATLDMLSGGRMLLVVCTGIVGGGASEAEGKPWGVTDKQRARRMSENIDIVRKLWSGQKTSFEGEFTGFEDLTVQPKPVQDPCPIWIASNPPIAKAGAMDVPFRRIARKADGWMTVQMFPGAFGTMWRRLQEILLEEGRDPATFPNFAYHNININEDKQAAYEETQKFLDNYYGPVFNEPMVRSWTAHGSPEECIQHIRDLRDQGVKEISFRITAWDQAKQYRRMVEEVLPFV